MEKLVLVGVDSGATKTEAVGMDTTSQVCVFTTEGPSNPSVVGIEKSSAVIARAVEKVLTSLGYEKPTPHIVAVGVAGVVNKSYADVLRKRLLELSGVSADRVVVFEDVVAAHASVFLSSDGVVGVLGTGSCVYGEFAGHSVRVGGWGHLLGDEGSGYRLGLKSLREVLECL
ncbi:MAG: BadF/BadG/BcrA/BcrD ATPase family protein, partial [Sulfolobales archaeon]